MFNYLIILILLPSINAINFNLTSKCNYPLNLYTNENNQFKKLCDLDNNQNNCQIEYNDIPSGLIKHTLDADATLFEFSINNIGIWYDISVIPPGSGICYSYEECRQKSKSDSFNVPIELIPKNINPLYTSSCVSLKCYDNQCQDAYLYPYDDLKTRFCPRNTNFDIIFCNNETVIDPVNETVIDPVNKQDISIIHINKDDRNKLSEMSVSVCKDASYLIPGPICSGSGNLPSGISCPLKGTETKYDCQTS